MVSKRLRVKLRRLWRRRGISIGLLCSFAGHGALLALLLLWSGFENTAAPRITALIVDIIEGPASGSPASGAEATPAAGAAAAPAPPLPKPQSESPSASPATKGDEERQAKPAARQDTATSIGEQLRGVEAAHGGSSPPSTGFGGSGVLDAAEANGTGATSLEDFLRVQIERRWQVDANAPNTLVSVRIVVAADGSVLAAEPLNDGGEDRIYRALAISARNAALLSSPLQFPRGTIALSGELIINLNTRDTRR